MRASIWDSVFFLVSFSLSPNDSFFVLPISLCQISLLSSPPPFTSASHSCSFVPSFLGCGGGGVSSIAAPPSWQHWVPQGCLPESCLHRPHLPSYLILCLRNWLGLGKLEVPLGQGLALLPTRPGFGSRGAAPLSPFHWYCKQGLLGSWWLLGSWL